MPGSDSAGRPSTVHEQRGDRTGVAPPTSPSRGVTVLLTFVAALVSAVAFVCAFPLPALWWLAPVIVSGFAVAACVAPSRRILVLAIGACWFGGWWWHQSWMGDVSAAGRPALVTYLTLHAIFGALVIRRLAATGPTARLPLVFWLPPVWIALETFRGEILFDGYPWYYVAHPLGEVPVLIQSADLLGTPLVGLLVAAVGAALVDALGPAFRSRRSGSLAPDHRLRAAGFALLSALLLANLGYGLHRLGESTSTDRGPTVLAIQTNLPQSNKMSWSVEAQIESFQGFSAQTVTAFDAALERGSRAGDPPRRRVPDVVVWPETMLPGFGLEPESIAAAVADSRTIGDGFARGIRGLATLLDRPILVGSPAYLGLRFDEKSLHWSRHFNSAYLLEPTGSHQRYDKMVLTPFGETMPYISAWPWLERQLLTVGARGMTFDLDRGDELRALTVPAQRGGFDRPWRIGVPICFEGTVAWFCRRLAWEGSTRRIDAFVNISNDGWFGSSIAGRMQHAQIARFRCVENRTPMVRSVNTGISVAYDSCGRIVEPDGAAPPLTEASIVVDLPLDARTPLWATVGNVLPNGCVGVTLALLAASVLPPRRNAAAK